MAGPLRRPPAPVNIAQLDNPKLSDTITRVSASPSVTVRIDLSILRANVRSVARRTGVPVLAVIKADAYSLGAPEVVRAIADDVAGFVVFDLHEAAAANVPDRAGLDTLVLGPPTPQARADAYRLLRARPAVWSVDQAQALRPARPILCVDTGMQRFACPAGRIDDVLAAASIDQAFTHAVRVEQVERFKELVGGRGLFLHAAASALLDRPEAWLDAVRPGLALYSGAARVSAPIVEARDSGTPAGYGGFVTPRFGVVLCGYSHGLRPGPCVVNGTRRRVIETGMQSSFIELGINDRIGDEVVLLGDGLSESEIAAEWNVSPQQALVRLCQSGGRVYSD